MERLYTILFFVLCPVMVAFTQEEIKPLASISTFQERLKEETANVTSIESDFSQEKYLDVFSEKIMSKGRFYYKQQDMIRMDYSSPLSYQMVINGGKLKIVSEGKSNIIHLGSNPMMKEIKEMISACMTGDLTNISSAYKVDYFETPTLYIVKLQPLSQSVKSYIREMVVSMDKKDMSVKTLRLSETAKDYTEYQFTNKKYNTLSSDEIFSIP